MYDSPGENGRLHSKPVMVHSSGGNAWRATMHLPLFQRVWMHFHGYDPPSSHHIFGWHPHLFWQHFQHKLHVWEVLCRSALMDFCLCSQMPSSMSLREYMLSPEGLTMPIQVQINQGWPLPRKVKDIIFPWGFANFYHCFIMDILKSQFTYCILPAKGTPGHPLMSAIPPLST